MMENNTYKMRAVENESDMARELTNTIMPASMKKKNEGTEK